MLRCTSKNINSELAQPRAWPSDERSLQGGKLFLMQVDRELPLYEQPALAPLSRWVECSWFLDTSEAVTGHRVPPDGCLDIVYNRSNGLRAIGTMTREQRFHFPEGAQLAGVRFRPGMAGTFLGVSPAELTDTSTPLEDLWPRRAREL